MTVTRGTTNRNARGSSDDRRRRREYLVATFAANAWTLDPPWFDLYGVPILHPTASPACRCYRCGRLLTVDTLTVDRIVPGCRGGTYRRSNIRPACASCNSETGGGVRS